MRARELLPDKDQAIRRRESVPAEAGGERLLHHPRLMRASAYIIRASLEFRHWQLAFGQKEGGTALHA